MANNFIPYGKQYLDVSDIEAVCSVLRSGWLTTGPVVEQFEEALAGKTGASYCLSFTSATAALHGAYYAAGLGPGDEVITSPITFAATANAALYLGARPVFVDIGENSFHIDPVKIESEITRLTKAIAPVDMSGMPAALDEIKTIAEANNLVVIEDACHALGANYKGRPVGSIADMSVFSFHPVKHITTGEGGAVTTDREEFYHRLRKFRNHGIIRNPELFEHGAESQNDEPWYYEQQELGYNYRLPDINCALGLSQLKKLDRFLARRRDIAARYKAAFKENSYLMIPPEPLGKNSLQEAAWHLYILRLAGESPPRKQILEKLYNKGIGTQVHYIPVYLHPYYRRLGYKPGLCSNAEDYYKRCFTIPLYPAMSDEEVERVVADVNNLARKLIN